MELSQQEVNFLSQNWVSKREEITPPPDDIIDAYQAGKTKAIDAYKEWLRELRDKKLLAAMSASTELIRVLKQKNKLDIKTAYLRQMISEDKCYHKTIIVINSEEYVDKKAKKAYQLLIDKSISHRKEQQLIIDFTLMPSGRFNHDLLLADGYVYEYGGKKKSRSTQ